MHVLTGSTLIGGERRVPESLAIGVELLLLLYSHGLGMRNMTYSVIYLGILCADLPHIHTHLIDLDAGNAFYFLFLVSLFL